MEPGSWRMVRGIFRDKARMQIVVAGTNVKAPLAVLECLNKREYARCQHWSCARRSGIDSGSAMSENSSQRRTAGAETSSGSEVEALSFFSQLCSGNTLKRIHSQYCRASVIVLNEAGIWKSSRQRWKLKNRSWLCRTLLLVPSKATKGLSRRISVIKTSSSTNSEILD